MGNTGRAVLVMLSLGAIPDSVSSSEPALTVGAGARSCAQFAREYVASPEIIETIYFTWAQGYLTGFARASNFNLDLMPDARGETWQKSFVREYCANNPLSPFSEAVAALNLEIRKYHAQHTSQ